MSKPAAAQRATNRTTPKPTLAVKEGPRKLFQRPEFVLMTHGREMCVVGGHTTQVIDGRRPYVSAMRIVQNMRLSPAKCLMVDERETTKIQQCREAGMRIVTVSHWERGTLEDREEHQVATGD